jgi:peptidoglycan hydrolase CwlO-like protein
MTNSSVSQNNTEYTEYTDYNAFIPIVFISTLTTLSTLLYCVYKNKSGKINKIPNIFDSNFNIFINTQNKINTNILKKYDNHDLMFNSLHKVINKVLNDNKILEEKIQENKLELQILKEKISTEYSFF